MIDTRWRKVGRDLWVHRSRTILVVVAMTIGLTGAATILNTWALVQRATSASYRASNPAVATLRLDSVDAALIERVRALPGIREVEARRTVSAVARTPGGARAALLTARERLDSVRIGQLRSEVGPWPPAEGAFTIERSSVDFSGLAVGEPVTLQVGDNPPQDLPVTGIVRDVGVAPGWMEHLVYGFVAPATLAQLGLPTWPNELLITVSDPHPTRDGVRRLAYRVKDLAETAGFVVTDVAVPEPGVHIHAAQMDSLLYTQGAFGLLALLLSAFLVVNLVTAMLAGQVRQIGIMKTLGGQTEQLAGMYLGWALVLGLAAAAVSLPIAAALGREYGALKAELLNFDVSGYSIPFWAIALQLVVGALTPVAAAAIPVARGCRVSVAEALRDVGITEGAAPRPGAGPAFARWGGLGRPILLSLRNAFRRRQRMALTLLALATGGAVYLGAVNLRASVQASVDLLYQGHRYDFTLRFTEPHRADSVERVVSGVPGVAGAEAWAGARAAVVHSDGTSSDAFQMVGLPPGSGMMAPPVGAGRWLLPSDENAAVITRSLLRHEPGLALGSVITLVVRGKPTTWTIVGIVESGPTPGVYVVRDAAGLAANGTVSALAVSAEIQGDGAQVELIGRLRGELERAGLVVASSQLLTESRRVIEDHLLMVVDFLGVMGWVMIAVGGLGLASTMSLAVLERTREIGVMRAIGARPGGILAIVQTEGLVIALLSWAAALPLSIPMSVLLGQAFGRVMFRVPIRYLPESAGAAAWLGLVLIVSVVASGWPAIRATRITTGAALKYE
jgi:putative ABC transport system permease protein